MSSSVNVTLAPVTVDNVETRLEMQPPPEQARWLANNACSIAQASFYPDWRINPSGAPLCEAYIIYRRCEISKVVNKVIQFA